MRVVAATVQTFFRLAADVEPPIPFPKASRIRPGSQYHAGRLLDVLAAGLAAGQRRLGVGDRDMSLPFLSYVFGEAQVGGRAAVVSSFRLRPDGPDTALLYERLAKVALHETGHLLGFSHCRSSGCIMNFSMGLHRLDRLELVLCPPCSNFLLNRF